jgi:hypothetical protein
MKEHFSLLLMPEQSFLRHVNQSKQELLSIHGKMYSSLSAPAHLSLCSVRLPAGKMAGLIPFLNSFFQETCALNLITGKVDFFAETGTLFLPLSNPEVYIAFQKRLVEALRNKETSLKRGLSFASTPHITLGRKLPKEALSGLSKGMSKYAKPMAFQANSVQLMFERGGKMTVYLTWPLSV